VLKTDSVSNNKHETKIKESSINSYARGKFSVETPPLSSSTSEPVEFAPAWRRQRLSLLTSTSPTALARFTAQGSPPELLALDRLFHS
jgi:hypothetical protein